MPVQMLGLAILIAGNLVWPHVWLWSVLGTCFYAFGIGLIFPTLFRFTLFSNDLPKGTVSASLNIVILSVSALSIEGARWLWFHGGRLPFHLLAVWWSKYLRNAGPDDEYHQWRFTQRRSYRFPRIYDSAGRRLFLP